LPNIVAVVKDDRVRRQIEQFLNELEMEDLRFATFKKLEEFEALYYRDMSQTSPEPSAAPDAVPGSPQFSAPPPPTDPTPAPAATEETELRLFSEVHLVIFALDSIGGKSAAFIEKVRTNLRLYKHWPAQGQVRFILMKYEDDGISKLDLLNPSLDDLIYLPLDRLIFLQKIEITVALPKQATPSFLFNQEVRHDIEISKIVKLDRLSDVGMAIRNPVPLKRDLPGKFYLQLPGEKNRLELRGKVLRSEPSPEHPGQSLVYFGFFGLAKAALTQIRRTLSKAPRYQSLKSEDREAVRWKPEELFATQEENRNFTLAIIDPDEAASNSLAQQLTKEMDRLHVVTESSYSLFLHKYFQVGGNSTKLGPPKPTEDKDLYSPLISMSVSLGDMKCLSVNPGPNEGDLFLGHNAQELFATPEKWLTLMQDKESKLILEEALFLADRGRLTDKLLSLVDHEGNRRSLNFKFCKSPTENVVMVDVSAAGLDDIMTKMTSEDTSKSLNVMIVDTSFVPEDTASWIEGLRTRALALKLIQNPKDLKFLIVSDGEAKGSEQWLANPDILGLFLKPVDTRQMLYFLSEHLDNINTLFHFNNLGWSAPGISIHVSKQVHLEALSEFGATLRSTAKLSPGSVVYLRKSIFDNAPNSCLAARIYFCIDHPTEKGYYQAFATYFGINEAFLKYARTWIRENYAHQKSKEGSS
jgi:hypothetical protein